MILLTNAKDWLEYPIGKPVGTLMGELEPSSRDRTNDVVIPSVTFSGKKDNQSSVFKRKCEAAQDIIQYAKVFLPYTCHNKLGYWANIHTQ